MITSNGLRIFLDDKSSITCYNYDAQDESWKTYGAHYLRGALKDGKVVKSNENIEIGFIANKGGTTVVAHKMGTKDIEIYKINVKTLIWKRVQVLSNIETSFFENGSYSLDFLGNHLAIIVQDKSGATDDNTLFFYAYDSDLGEFVLKNTINNVTTIANPKSKLFSCFNKSASRLFISDTNGNINDPISNDNDNGVVQIYDIVYNDENGEYTLTNTATLSSVNTSSLFGYGISTNDIGNRVAICEPLNHLIYVYDYDDSTSSWSVPNGFDIDSIDTTSGRYHTSIDMNALGDAFFIGEYDESEIENGLVYGFYLDISNNWQLYQTLSGDFYDANSNTFAQVSTNFDFTNTSNFGSLVSINAQGTTLLLGSKNPSDESNKAILIKDPKMSNVKLTDLGLSPEEIVNLSLTPQELVNNSGLDTSSLKNLGVNANVLLTGGKTESELYDNGFELSDIVSSSSNLSGLINDPSNTLISTDLLGLASVNEIINKGIQLSSLLSDLSGLSDISNIDISQFKLASVSATDLKNSAGLSATTLVQSAYEATDLVTAGYPVSELKEASLGATDLKNAGVSLIEMDNEYDTEDLVQANFSDTDFQNAGYNVSESQSIDMQLGQVSVTQTAKTFTKNSSISVVNTTTLSDTSLNDFLQTNTSAANVIEINASDNQGGGISDVSSQNIIVQFSFPNLDPTQDNYLVKYDETTNEMYDPQPYGYPVKLNYNAELSLYTASLKQLSLLSTFFAAVPTSDYQDNQAYLVSIDKLSLGGVTNYSRNQIYLVSPLSKNFDSGSTGIYKNNGSKNAKLNSTNLANLKSCFDITNAQIVSAQVLGNNNGKKRTKLALLNNIKEYYEANDISHSLIVPANINGPTLKHCNCISMIIENDTDIVSGDEITITINDNMKFSGNISIPNTTFNYTYAESIVPVIINFYITNEEVFYFHYPDPTDESIVEYHTNKSATFRLFFITNTFINVTPDPSDLLKLENAAVAMLKIEPNKTNHFMDIAGILDSESKSTNVSVTFPIGVITSKTGDPSEESFSFSYVIDTEPPEMTITSSSESGSYSISNYVLLTFNFSEQIRSLSVDDFNCVNCTLVDLTQTDILTYTAYAQTESEFVEVTASVQLPISSVLDLAGNTNSNPSNKFIINFDTISPVLQIKTDDIENGQFYNLPFVDFTIQSSEIITGLEYSDISSNGGILSRLTPAEESDVYTFRLTPDNLLENQKIEIFIPEKSVNDINGNRNSQESAHFIWNYDIGKPIITVASTASASVSSQSYIEYFIQSSREIADITLSSFEHNDACALADLIQQPGKASGYFYQLKLFPLNNFSPTSFKVKANGIRDITNNYNELESNTFTWQYNGVSPTISIISEDIDMNGNSSNQNITLKIKISDITLVLTQDMITVDQGTISNLTYDDINYQFVCTYTAVAPYSTHSVFISQNQLIDSNGIGNNKSNVLSWIWDKPKPSVSLSSVDVDNDGYTNNRNIGIKITRSETLVGFDHNNLTIENGIITGYDSVNDIVSISPVSTVNEAVISVYMDVNNYKDEYDNFNDTASNIYRWNYDNIPPEISVISTSMIDGATNNKYSIDVEFVLSKVLKSFTTSQITAINASLSNFKQTSPTNYTAVLGYIPQTSNAVLSISLYVDTNSVQDYAGNGNIKSNVFEWISDRVPPRVTKISASKGVIHNSAIQYTNKVANTYQIIYEFNKPLKDFTFGAFQIYDTKKKNNENADEEDLPYIVRGFSNQSNPLLGIYKYVLNFRPIISFNVQASYYTRGSLYLPENTFQDEYGNVNTEASDPFTFIQDKSVPVLSFRATSTPDENGLVRDISNNSTTNDGSILLYVESSKILNSSNINSNALIVNNGSIESSAEIMINSALYVFKVTPDYNNTVVEISMNGIFGKYAKNKNQLAVNPSESFYWTSDTVRAIPTISSPTFNLLQSNITNEQDISVNIQFTKEPASFNELDLSFVNCSYIETSFGISGDIYYLSARADPTIGKTDEIEIRIPENNNIVDNVGNISNSASLTWYYINERPKVLSLNSDNIVIDSYSSESIIDLNVQFSTLVIIESSKLILKNCEIFSPFEESETNSNLYHAKFKVIFEDDDTYKGEIKITIPPSSFYDIVNHTTVRYNNESYSFQYNYMNHTPKVIISGNIANNSTTNTSSIDLYFSDEMGEQLYDFTQSDILLTYGSNVNSSDVYIDPTSFAQIGTKYFAKVIATKDTDVNVTINPYSVSNITNTNNITFSRFKWTRDTSPVTFNIFGTNLISGQESEDSSLNIIIESNKKININQLKTNIQVVNASISAIVDQEPDTNPGKKFQSSLVPLKKNTQSSIKVLSDSYQYIYDDYGNYNTEDSNTFYWTFSGANPTVSLISSNVANGVISSIQDLSFIVQITGDQVSLQESYIEFTPGSGVLSNFIDYSDGSYSFDFKVDDNYKAQELNIYVPSGKFRDNFSVPNLASSTFVYTFDDSQPFITITCEETPNNSYSQFSEYNFVFTISTDVNGFNLDDISHSGGEFQGGLIYENGVYKAKYIPTITAGDLIIDVPENVCFDKTNGAGNAAATSPFTISYDIETPILEISSNVLSGSSTSDSEALIDLSFSKDIVDFNVSKIFKSDNYELIKKPNTNLRFYQVRILPKNSQYINFQVYENVFHDKFGNGNNESPLFQWRSDSDGAFITITSSLFEGRISNNGIFRTANTVIPITIELSDDDDNLTFDITNIVLVNATILNSVMYQDTLNPKKYTLELTHDVDEIESSIYIPEGVILDSAGNANNASNTISWFYSNKIPTVKISSPDISSNEKSNTTSITIYLDTSEQIEGGFNAGYLALINCVIKDGKFTYLGQLSDSDDGTLYHRYTCSIKFASGGIDTGNVVVQADQIASIQILEGVVVDELQAVNQASEVFYWNYDSIAPRLSLQSAVTLDSLYYEYDVLPMILNIENDDVPITINVGDFTTTNCNVTDLTYIDNSKYTFNLQSVQSNTDCLIYIDKGKFSDNAGNINERTNYFKWVHDDAQLTISSLVARVGGKTLENTGKTNNPELIVAIEFSEKIFNFNSEYITAANCLVNSVTTSPENPNLYNVSVTTISKFASLTFVADKKITTGKYVEKLISNIPVFEWEYDITQPEFKIICEQQLNNTLSNVEYLDISFQSNKPVVGFDANVIDVVGDVTISNFTSNSDENGVGNLYGARFTPTTGTTQDIIIQVKKNTVYDEYGNINEYDTSFGWFYDNTPIEVEITGILPSGSVETEIPYIDLSFTFSEALKSFDLTMIDLDNGSLSIPTKISDTVYVSTLRPSVPGLQNTVTINPNKISDIIGNTNLNTVSYIWTYEGSEVVPSLSSSDVSNGGFYKSDTIEVNINTDDAVVADFNNTDYFSVSNGNISNVIQGDDQYSWKLQLQSTNPSNETSLFVKANAVQDLNGNPNIQSGIFTWTYDNTAPTCTISSLNINSGDYTNDSSIFISFNMSESVVFDQTKIYVENGFIANFTGSNDTYSAKLIPNSGIQSGALSVIVPPGAITDIALNTNDSSSNEFIWNYDNAAPTIVLSSDDVFNNNKTDLSYVTIKAVASEPIVLTSSHFSFINCAFVSISEELNNTFDVIVRTTDWSVDKKCEVFIRSFMFQDIAGNYNIDDSNTYKFTINKEVIRKKSAPEIIDFLDNDTDTPDSEKPSEIAINAALDKKFNVTDENGYVELATTFITKDTNTKVFKLIMDQMFETDDNKDKKKIKVKRDSIPMKTKVREKLTTTNKSSVIIAKSNQKVKIEDLVTNIEEDAVYIPMSQLNDYFEIDLSDNGVSKTFRITQTDTDIFSVTDNATYSEVFDANDENNDTFTFFNYSLFFGSVTVTYTTPEPIVEEPTDPTEPTDPNYIPGVAWVPCFLENTEILTTNGYVLVQNLVANTHKLVDINNKTLPCLEVKEYIKTYDDIEFPRVIPVGAELTETHKCTKDLYMTYNHSIYNPNNNSYIPMYRMKTRQDKTKCKFYKYYHVFTPNFFCDTIIANGIPCETHSKYIKQYINSIDKSGKNELMKTILMACKAQPDGMRQRLTYDEFNNIVNIWVSQQKPQNKNINKKSKNKRRKK